MKFNKTFFRVVEILPIAIPAVIAVFGVVAMVLLLMGAMSNALVWPIGLTGSLITFGYTYKHAKIKRLDTKKERRISDILILVLAIGWAGFNAFYTSQHIQVNRDPAIYAVTGAWLSDNNSLNFANKDAFENFDDDLGRSAGAGFHPKDKVIYAQGQHLLPAILGLVGRVTGYSNALHFNVAFGATSIMAVYALARLMVKSRWALFGALAFSAMFPLIYFSRDTYTEPLMATLTMGGLALLWAAKESKSLPLWFVAGLTFGASTMNRIDAYVAVAGILIFLIIMLALATGRAKRKLALKQVAAIVAGLVITSIIGLIDLVSKSPVYYNNLSGFVKLEFILLAALVIIGTVFVYLAWTKGLLKRIDRFTRGWRAQAAAAFILLGSVLLASRVLWFNGHRGSKIGLVESLQAKEGFASDGFRTFAENTTDWLSWYMGPLILSLAVIGLSIAAYRAASKKDLLYVPAVLAITVSTILYLFHPRITPDQIWASRRFLSVVIPGLTVFATIGLAVVYNNVLSKLSPIIKRSAIVSILLIALIQPLQITRPFTFQRTTTQLDTILEVCATLDKIENPAVMWVGSAAGQLPMATYVFCGVSSTGISSKKSVLQPAQLSSESLAKAAANAREKGKTPLIGTFGSQVGVLDPVEWNTTHIFTYNYYQVERTLTYPPKSRVGATDSIVLGVITELGNIEPLTEVVR